MPAYCVAFRGWPGDTRAGLSVDSDVQVGESLGDVEICTTTMRVCLGGPRVTNCFCDFSTLAA